MKESSQAIASLGGVSIDQFKVIESNLGKGSYGEVKLVERDGKRFALKQLYKEEIIKVSFFIAFS